MVEGAVEFVHGVRAECVADLGAVECDAHGGQIAYDFAVFVALNLAVVGDVCEVLEALNDAPVGGVEDVRDLFGKLCSHRPYFTALGHGRGCGTGLPGIDEGPDRVCAARASQYEMDVIYPLIILSIRSGIALEGFGPIWLKAIFGSFLLALIDAS